VDALRPLALAGRSVRPAPPSAPLPLARPGGVAAPSRCVSRSADTTCASGHEAPARSRLRALAIDLDPHRL